MGLHHGGAKGGPKVVPGDSRDWNCSHLTAEGGGIARGLEDGVVGGGDGGAVLHQQGDIHGLGPSRHRTNINTRVRPVNTDQGEYFAILDNRGLWKQKEK